MAQRHSVPLQVFGYANCSIVPKGIDPAYPRNNAGDVGANRNLIHINVLFKASALRGRIAAQLAPVDKPGAIRSRDYLF